MKVSLSILSTSLLLIFAHASPHQAPGVLVSNTTLVEKHGCPIGRCNGTHSAASSLSPGCLEVIYGVILLSFAALA
jgi:hypothetical protein